jgi:putative flippase GtrA
MPPSSFPPAGLSAFLSKKFLKFCAVGFSGVFVNLGALTLFTSFGLLSSLASALAIYISILSNFVMNEWWTFRDQRGSTGIVTRALRFQVVSLVGAAIQWSIFLIVNVGCLWWIQGAETEDAYFAASSGWFLGVI